MIIEGMHYNENCECEGCKRVSGKSKKIGGTSIAQAIAEDRERMRGEIEGRRLNPAKINQERLAEYHTHNDLINDLLSSIDINNLKK